MGFNVAEMLPIVIFTTYVLISQRTLKAESRIVCSKVDTNNPSDKIIRFWIRRQRQQTLNPQAELKRPNFHPWAGKRSEQNSQEDFSDVFRRAFHAWGGKRSETNIPANFQDVIRRAFHAWGGKRLAGLQNLNSDFINIGPENIPLNSGKNEISDDKALPEKDNIQPYTSDGDVLSTNKLDIKRDFGAWGGR
ncbi:uncharacterized protein LOC110464877 [Mizuhopecten yessoensis]|uniref:Lymnokinin n=1 Tax=Mizuhopecten yessoensis TaxID=6573 RepID=A0A346GAU9_MIZYE|nr:uncharacterized protein LOC110464877 [Mizuhopecten yessoensis]AXN93502.1 lymnokinin [Mizuhopecten yessoensis]